MLENNVKLIVFAHHMIMLDGLEDAISQKGYKYMRIDGTVGSEERHNRVNNFQEDSKIVVALLSITAAGVGLTLTASSTIVFAELHWTPGIMIQAEDRAHRIGQKSSVNCHYLIG
jgi:SWI/SNF-related matrix-associated actin-dependent regulator 1 of chromatin subfamily A